MIVYCVGCGCQSHDTDESKAKWLMPVCQGCAHRLDVREYLNLIRMPEPIYVPRESNESI